MSRSAGLLAMKRVNCKWSGGNWECATFKSGLCIDVGQEVWTHYWNDWIGSDYNANAKSFASAAVDIMKQHESQGKQHLTSNTGAKISAIPTVAPTEMHATRRRMGLTLVLPGSGCRVRLGRRSPGNGTALHSGGSQHGAFRQANLLTHNAVRTKVINTSTPAARHTPLG